MSAVERPAPEAITLRIATVRGQREPLDADLAALLRRAPTKRFDEAVKRNLAKFPADFMVQLTADEWASSTSQFATLDDGRTGRGQHRKYLPYAFTEHGAIMAATILSSPRAIEVSVYVVRAFVRMRELAVTHGDLAKRPIGFVTRWDPTGHVFTLTQAPQRISLMPHVRRATTMVATAGIAAATPASKQSISRFDLVRLEVANLYASKGTRISSAKLAARIVVPTMRLPRER